VLKYTTAAELTCHADLQTFREHLDISYQFMPSALLFGPQNELARNDYNETFGADGDCGV
jgi:hypothetical protein